MRLKYLLALFRMPHLLHLLGIIRDWRSLIRMHFIYTALETGLLHALQTPRSRDELIRELDVQRADILDAVLDVGLSLGELARKGRKYTVRGRRSKTVMGEDVFIGSDSQMVAPVTVGDGAYVASGSTITKDVPPDALALSRVKQTNREGTAARLKQRLKAKKEAKLKEKAAEEKQNKKKKAK